MLHSWDLEQSAWACHGLACVYLLTGRNAQAVRWVLSGLKLEDAHISYFKESLKILDLCKAYEEIVDFFEKQTPKVQQVGKLKYYYIAALHGLGKDEKLMKL